MAELEDTVVTGGDSAMQLMLLLPTEVLLDVTTVKIVAEAENGCFCLLPNHVDFLARLVPGILTYEDPAGRERYIAVDEGTLVKCGRVVRVSTPNAVADSDLDRLQATLRATLQSLDEEERRARSALARLEAAALRGFAHMESTGRVG